MMFEYLSSSILDLELGTSGEFTFVVSGSEVEVVAPQSMFLSTLDAFIMTSRLYV